MASTPAHSPGARCAAAATDPAPRTVVSTTRLDPRDEVASAATDLLVAIEAAVLALAMRAASSDSGGSRRGRIASGFRFFLVATGVAAGTGAALHGSSPIGDTPCAGGFGGSLCWPSAGPRWRAGGPVPRSPWDPVTPRAWTRSQPPRTSRMGRGSCPVRRRSAPRSLPICRPRRSSGRRSRRASRIRTSGRSASPRSFVAGRRFVQADQPRW